MNLEERTHNKHRGRRMEQLTAGKHYEKEFQEKENRREEPKRRQ